MDDERNKSMTEEKVVFVPCPFPLGRDYFNRQRYYLERTIKNMTIFSLRVRSLCSYISRSEVRKVLTTYKLSGLSLIAQ